MPSAFPRPERPTGIIRTLPWYGAEDSKHTDSEKGQAYRRMMRAYKAIDTTGDGQVLIALPQQPKIEVLHLYVLIGGQIRVRGNIAGWEAGDGSHVESWDGHDLKDSKWWCLVTGPVSWPPETMLRRGHQGFRYCSDLW